MKLTSLGLIPQVFTRAFEAIFFKNRFDKDFSFLKELIVFKFPALFLL